MREFTPLRKLRQWSILASLAHPVAWSAGAVLVTVYPSSQAAAQFNPPASAAVSPPPSSPTAPPASAAFSPPPSSPTAPPPSSPLAAPNFAKENPAMVARQHLERAKKAFESGQVNAAVQAYGTAMSMANSAPELKGDLQAMRDTLLKRGIAASSLDAAIQAVANQPPLVSGSNLPSNPLRDQAAALSAQAKLALDRGDVKSARHLIDQANSLRVPDNAFSLGQVRPWQVMMDIQKAESLRPTQGEPPSSLPSTKPTITTAANSMPSAPPTGAPLTGVPGNVATAAASTQNGNATEGNLVKPSLFNPGQDSTKVSKASTQQRPSSLPTNGKSGDALYREGIEALSAGNRDKALQLFQQAWKFEGELDPQVRTQLRDKLMLMQAKSSSAQPPEAIRGIPEVSQEQRLLQQKMFREVTGEIAEAEKMVNDDPFKALDRLQLLRQRVSQSQLEGTARKNQLAMIDRVINNIQTYVDHNKATIEQTQSNRQIEERMAADAANLVRVEAEKKRLVDQWNDLNAKGQYAEAEIVARKVQELDPNSEIASVLYSRSKIQRRNAEDAMLRDSKEQFFVDSMQGVDRASIGISDEQPYSMPDASGWTALTRMRRKYGENDRSSMSPAEMRIREVLGMPITVSFDATPLNQAMDTISDMTGIPIFVDVQGLKNEGYLSDIPVTLNLKGKEIALRSALNLMLEPLGLAYAPSDDVLKITGKSSLRRTQIEQVYSVKDLVIPIPNFIPDYNTGLAGALRSAYVNHGQPLLVQAESKSGLRVGSGAQMASLDPNLDVLGQVNMPMMPNGMPMPVMPWGNNPPAMGIPQGNPFASAIPNMGRPGGAAMADFNSLMQLIQTTIDSNWDVDGGEDTMQPFFSNLTLVVKAPQETHQAIADLLESLRKLQNLQVTIEVRFITLSDQFFERMGVDFEFQIDDNVGRLPYEDRGPSVSIGVDRSAAGGFTPRGDLDLKFSQDSFAITPPFGGFSADNAGRFGFAILSDIELFFLLEAAQGDSRTNVMQAPKVTMFDGQFASINDTSQRPFVAGLTPVVGDFAVAQQPIVVVLSEGTQLTVQSVVTPDKRFVRMTLLPMFSRVEDRDRTFTFTGSRTTRSGSTVLDPNGDPTDERDDEEEIIEGSTVQLPTFAQTSVSTTVTVPDGGTILLGGIKRLREGRTERGIPMLSKIPYLNRLFKNTAIGRETSTLMLTVTPRIIIPEEEEEKVTGVAAP